jgi:DNA helicase HerA-like ATPase
MAEQPFPEKFFGALDARPQRLGVVVGGSLSDGLLIKLDKQAVIEGVMVGSYVTIIGQTGRKFFGMITDVKLESTNRGGMTSLSVENEAIAEIYRSTLAYGALLVKPLLVVEAGKREPKPVRSVPTHFTIAYRSTADEMALIFPQEDDSYAIGESLDNPGIQVYIPLRKLVERSTAVFGRSGTGKTFLTLPLLAHIIKKDLASVLIFDMHNDYGHTLKGDGNQKFKGLKQLSAISHKVVIATLDPESSRRRRSGALFDLQIGYDQIEPEDIATLQSVFALTDVQVNALHWLRRRFGKEWFKKLLSGEEDSELAELVEQDKLHSGTLNAMQRKLQVFSKFEFVRDEVAQDAVAQILGHLQRGNSVVVEFGRYGDSQEAYLLVSNLLTRRIHERYKEMKEAAQGGSSEEPRQLVIVIEEAHKFLQPGIADLTTFGTIARELRKYNVTLLIVDQRPSQIDSEVMSQIGTRITCALSDERDIAAVLAGVSGANQLRSVLAALESKQQALIMGHAVPTPVVVRTTPYGEAVYRQFARPEDDLPPEERARLNQVKLGRPKPEEEANALV